MRIFSLNFPVNFLIAYYARGNILFNSCYHREIMTHMTTTTKNKLNMHCDDNMTVS